MRAVNLIPSEQRSSGAVATRSGGAAYFVLGLLGGLVVLALLYGSAHRQIASRSSEAAKLSAQAREVQDQAAQLAPYTSFVAMREQRAQAVAQLVGSRFDWSNLMGELSRVLPGDVSVSSLSGTVGAATPSASTPSASAKGASSVSSVTPPGAVPTFTIGGCATSQAVVAQTLVRLRLLEGVSSVDLQSSTKSSTGGSGSSSSASSGGSSGAGCSGSDPAFTVVVSFDPLPAAPALTESPRSTASDTVGGAAAAAGGGAATGGTR
jgi:Tfp pilus assembly protein PilN